MTRSLAVRTREFRQPRHTSSAVFLLADVPAARASAALGDVRAASRQYGHCRQARAERRSSPSVMQARRAGSIGGLPAVAHDRPQRGEAATMRHSGGERLMR